MKHFKSLLAVVLFAFIASFTQAQTAVPAAPAVVAPTAAAAAPAASTNYFVGKWDVLIKGTPNGDPTVAMRFDMKDGKAKGYFTVPDSKEEKEMTSAEITGDELNVAFTITGYDVTMKLTKKDDEHANGKLMDMFDCEGTKKKE